MIQSVLFDLDGTLLPLDQQEFVKVYLNLLGRHVAPYADPKKFVGQLLSSTGVMIANRDKVKTNKAVFYEDFLPKIGVAEEVLAPALDLFYEQHFGQVRSVTQPSPAARQAVLAAIHAGCDVVVATNPIFPGNAVEQRLEWAGVADLDFKLITSYENSCFCKPHPEYYLEIADRIGRHPSECLMIGNDVEEDLIAGIVGMKTYLVTDCLLNAKGLEARPDYSSALSEVAESLPGIIRGK
ncbi:HAD family hydrolase [Acetonema longum]|uniref:Hydrolase n=1 Tax=Acetonema longum DSM 6540 TaxID=1009370 RepID=F7NQG1_9FIRM|nr:HAD family hydrolase [Acetonema longum]EGO61739.1 hydrolase [Acetonema longum DSM 6540]